MLLAMRDTIRDVIAFPKAASGADPLTGAPTPITPEQRREAGIDAIVPAGGETPDLTPGTSPPGPDALAPGRRPRRRAGHARLADSVRVWYGQAAPTARRRTAFSTRPGKKRRGRPPRSRCGCARAPWTRWSAAAPDRRGAPLRKLAENDAGMSVVLWGPPGTGKTTLAHVVSQVTSRRFTELSAVTAGVKDVRAAIEKARRELGLTGTQTVLFIDEVHRFNKAQQDALLPAVENRWVSFIGATTENPSFSVVGPLLSRSLLLTLEPLSDDDIRAVVSRALADERGLGGAVSLDDQALDHLIRLASGDARRALTYLESAALGLRPGATIASTCWSGRWTAPRSATTATAISTTT